MKPATPEQQLRTEGCAQTVIRTILVPTDFSGPARKAAEYAAGFCERFGARMLLLHVTEGWHPGSIAEGVASRDLHREVIDAAERKLREWQRSLERTAKVHTYLRQGRAWQEIVGFAQRACADMIIIGSHGYTGLKHLTLGSTAERVVRHASCPVLVVGRP